MSKEHTAESRPKFVRPTFDKGLDPSTSYAISHRVFPEWYGTNPPFRLKPDLDSRRSKLLADYMERMELHFNNILNAENFCYADEFAYIMANASGHAITSSDIDTFREQNAILGVSYHDQWVYPEFQLSPETGLPSDLIEQVASTYATDFYTGYHHMLWWLSERDDLCGGNFASVLHTPRGRELILQDLSRFSKRSYDL